MNKVMLTILQKKMINVLTLSIQDRRERDIPGWLHKDGMTLMFYNNDID